MLKLGELVAFIRADDSDFDRDVDRAERRFDRFGSHIGDAADHAAAAAGAAGGRGGQGFADAFWRDASGRLHDTATGRFVSEAAAAGEEGGRALGEGVGRGAGNAGTAVTNLATNLWNLLPVLLAVAAAAVFAGPAVYAFGGALAAIPALLSGAAAVLAVLGIGFLGLGDAFGKSAAAGGNAAQKADQVAHAQRALAQAQRDAADATEAVNRAREDEVERLEDLSRSLARARFDEGAATRAVTMAERELAKARAGGNADKIADAQENLDRAKLDLADVKDRVEDLSKEQAKADKAGVEGSDQVKAALDRQRRAADQVVDAQAALRQAQHSGGGGAAAEVTKLAPAAAAFVAIVKSLKPQWENLRLSVQQKLFAGVAGEVKGLARIWLPFLKTGLGSFASTINGIFKVFAGTAKKPEFIAGIGAGLAAVDRLVGKVGKALAGPFLDAWGRLSRAAGPVVDLLGDKLAGGVESFAKWIESADKSGKLQQFMAQAARYLGEIWDLGGDAVKVLGDFLAVVTGTADNSGVDPIESISKGLRKLDDWLQDPEHRKMLAQFFNEAIHVGGLLADLIGWLVGTGIPWMLHARDEIGKGIDAVAGWIRSIGDAKDWVVNKLEQLVAWAGGLPQRMGRAAAGLWDGIKDGFRDAVNWVIGRWNRLQFTIGGGSFLGMSIPSATFSTPDIPYLAAGGTALRAGMAMVAERGPEAIYMPAGARAEPLSPGWRNRDAAGGPVRVTGELLVRGTGLLAGLREYVAVQGGTVQAVLGNG